MSLTPPETGPPCGKGLFRQLWSSIFEHELFTRASAIAFSSISAAVPLLAVVLLVLIQLLPDIGSSVTSGHEGLGVLMLHELQLALQAVFPPEAYKVVEEQIARVQTDPPIGVLGIGIAITLWTASGVFRAAMDAMNRVYGVVEQRPFWRVWLLSVWMTIVQTLILTGALLLVIAWPYFLGKLGLSNVWVLSEGVRDLIVIVVVLLSYAMVFRRGPDVPQQHRWLTVGSFVATVLFFLTCWGLKMYVENFAHYDRTYGSLGGLMIIFLWFWANSLVFLLAAEINRICCWGAGQRKLRRP